MNGVHESEPRTAARLTNLLYTDPSQHLPLPQAPAPASAATTDMPVAAEAAFAQDASFLDRAASLLQAADLPYMYVGFELMRFNAVICWSHGAAGLIRKRRRPNQITPRRWL